ncbi:MAG: serine protease [Proteobacteria bacterium]|nr:serine protease [Pseudomonadota bacterium]MBU1714125.1 serine protease [Pseudomonadota bacterium]
MKLYFMPIVLQLAGLAVVIAEIFLPSGGLLALIAFGLFGYSLFMVFHDISAMAGTLFALADFFMVPVMVFFGLKIMARSPITLNETLSRAKGVVSQSAELENFRDCEGKSISVLRPGGMAMFNGKRVDVVSRGEYIEKDRDIVVIEVTGNQIIVREK